MRMPALLALAILLLPSASAQTEEVQVSLGDLSALLEPGGEPVEIPFSVSFSCALLTGGAATPVLLQMDAPPWAEVVLEPEGFAASASGCALGTWQGSGTARVAATDRAPGLVPTPATLNVSVRSADRERGGGAQVELTAAFVGAFEARVPVDFKVDKPQTTMRFIVELESRANAPIKVSFDIRDAPAGKWQVLAPAPVLLQSPLEGGKGSTLQVEVAVQTPYENGYVTENASFTLHMRSEHAGQPASAGEARALQLHAETRGFYAPGPGAWALLVLAAAAFVRTGRGAAKLAAR